MRGWLTVESRQHWQSGESNLKRGMDWLDRIYKANHNATEDALAAHKDFGMMKSFELKGPHTNHDLQHGSRKRSLTAYTFLTTVSWMVSIQNLWFSAASCYRISRQRLAGTCAAPGGSVLATPMLRPYSNA